MTAAATVDREIVFKPTPRQSEFISACEREVLLAGGLGSGKSTALLLSAAHASGNPAHRALILRKTFPQHRTMIAKSLEIFPHLGGTWNESKSTWKFSSGARIEFGFLDGPQDCARWLGREFNFIGIDEICEWPADAEDASGEPISYGYKFLMSRLRTPRGTNLPLEIRCTAVPLGVGRDWVKHRWGIPDDGGPSLVSDPATGLHRRFVRALLGDNPALGADGAYRRTLESLSKNERAALVQGRWDSCVGGVFDFDHEINTVAPFDIPASWLKWRSCDDGWRAPLACLWFAWDKDATDTIFVVRELYAPKLTPEQAVRAILEIDATIGDGAKLSGPIDSAAFSTFGTGESRGDQMNKMGCRWSPVEKGSGSVLAGLGEIHRRLAVRDDGSPGLRVFRGCAPNLVRELVSAVHSPTNPEMIADNCSNHAIDALAYGLRWRRPSVKRLRLAGI
jgi:Terminase large subunit, T4likevirus-type, N-terminal